MRRFWRGLGRALTWPFRILGDVIEFALEVIFK